MAHISWHYQQVPCVSSKLPPGMSNTFSPLVGSNTCWIRKLSCKLNNFWSSVPVDIDYASVVLQSAFSSFPSHLIMESLVLLPTWCFHYTRLWDQGMLFQWTKSQTPKSERSQPDQWTSQRSHSQTHVVGCNEGWVDTCPISFVGAAIWDVSLEGLCWRSC